MNGSLLVLAASLAAWLAAPVAAAQTPPASAAPPATTHSTTTPPAPTKPAPTKPAAAKPPPAGSMLGHSAPGKPARPVARKTPLVTAPASAHAQKPAPATPKTAKPKPAAPAKEGPKPAPPPPEPARPAAAPEAPPSEPNKGTVTGLPLPRWASLKADEVNLRSGPGTRYPIEWVYHRVNLPVQIEREFEVWRLVEDQDGVKGWVHQATLTGRRSFVVKGEERTMRKSPADTATAVARLKPGVVGQVRSCAPRSAWCEVQVGDYRGNLRRDEIFGIYPGEGVN